MNILLRVAEIREPLLQTQVRDLKLECFSISDSTLSLDRDHEAKGKLDSRRQPPASFTPRSLQGTRVNRMEEQGNPMIRF